MRKANLIEAVRIDDISKAKTALLEGADPNFMERENGTLSFAALHWAKSREMVDTLIAHGADINLPSNANITPLLYRTFYATNDGPQAAIRLIELGADVNLADRRGATPLHMAAQYGPIECIEALLRSGRCNVDLRDEEGMTAYEKAKAKNPQNADLMLSIMSEINIESSWGNASTTSALSPKKGLSL